jgi:hypothetical protein
MEAEEYGDINSGTKMFGRYHPSQCPVSYAYRQKKSSAPVLLRSPFPALFNNWIAWDSTGFWLG